MEFLVQPEITLFHNCNEYSHIYSISTYLPNLSNFGSMKVSQFIFKSLCFTYVWGSILDGVLLFQYSFLSGALFISSWDGVVIKSGGLMEPIR